MAAAIRRPAAAGFTLVELLAVLGVLVALFAAAPGLRQLVHGVQLGVIANSVHASLTIARSEAIKRNGRVSLCKSADGQTCTPHGSWEQGWIVFHDSDSDALRSPAESLVYAEPASRPGYRIFGNQTVERYISFGTAGETRLASGAFQAGTITICRIGTGAIEGRQVIINAIGRARVKRVTMVQCR